MSQYHVTCPRCGQMFSADNMAFDFDYVLERALRGQGQRMSGGGTACFLETRLGLYLTCRQLEDIYGVTKDSPRMNLTAGSILAIIQDRYGVDATEYEAAAKESVFPDLVTDPYASPAFSRFCDQLLALSREKDVNLEQQHRNVKAICHYLKQHRRDLEPICSVQVRVQMEENDTPEHDLYPSRLEVVYAGGRSREMIDHRVCPYCGGRLHRLAGKHQEYVIGMVGSARVGKTAYLAALINALKPQRGRSDIPGISVVSDSDAGWTRFERRVLVPYRKGMRIQKTEVADEMASLFTVPVRVREGTYLFTFVDMPGEAFVPPDQGSAKEPDYDFIVQNRPILKHTDMFWLCIDPYQVDDRLELAAGADASEDLVDTDMSHVMGHVVPVLSYLRSSRLTKAAVLLTKSDLLAALGEKLFDPMGSDVGALLNKEGFRVDVYANRAEAVRRYFHAPYVTDLEGDFHSMFDQYQYFAVAAYGRTVSSGAQEASPGNLPSHVPDPFLWTLAALGLLPTLAYQEWEEKRGFRRKKVRGIRRVDPALLYTLNDVQ